MKEYYMEVLVTQTYHCTVKAKSEEEAKEKAISEWEQRNTDFVDEEVMSVEVID